MMVMMIHSQRPVRVSSTISSMRTSSMRTSSMREIRSGVHWLPGLHASLRMPQRSGVALSPVRSPSSERSALVTARATGSGEVSTNSNNAPSTIWTIPTILTLFRVVAIPLLVAAWFSSQWMWCFSIFVGASVTDFFDGYLARKWECSTPFGAFLDPVADKLMVATILILIGTVPVPAGYFAGNAWLLPAIACVIISREITMSALREWAAALGPEAHAAAAVNKLGKYKTSSQMVSLVLLLGAKTGACRSGALFVSLLCVPLAFSRRYLQHLVTGASDVHVSSVFASNRLVDACRV